MAFGCCNAVLGLAPNAWSAAVLALPVGYTVMVSVAGMNALIQLQTPAHMRGRVMALVSVVLVGSSPVGGPIIGLLAERLVPRLHSPSVVRWQWPPPRSP